MPKYKRIVALNSLTHNGKEYTKGKELDGYQPLTEKEAELLNENPTITGFRYELIEEETAFDKLKKEAKELGINFAKNITEEKLQEKVNEAKKQNDD